MPLLYQYYSGLWNVFNFPAGSQLKDYRLIVIPFASDCKISSIYFISVVSDSSFNSQIKLLLIKINWCQSSMQENLKPESGTSLHQLTSFRSRNRRLLFLSIKPAKKLKFHWNTKWSISKQHHALCWKINTDNTPTERLKN